MRLSNTQAVARPTYYDRNPTAKHFSYSAIGVAPHTSTARWTYTVPAGRKGFAEAIQSSVLRLSVATAAGFLDCGVQYTPSGGVAGYDIQAMITTNVIGDRNDTLLSQYGELGPGDNVQGISEDVSTGGTSRILIALKMNEFDA